MGLGKLLVVAPDQENARQYLGWLRGWVPRAQAEHTVRIATSDERDAHATLAAFRLRPEPSILVTCAMAYEGLDAPSVAVCAALTHIRSRAWLEQMIARATRVDPAAGPYQAQSALVLHPDDQDPFSPASAENRGDPGVHGGRVPAPGPSAGIAAPSVSARPHNLPSAAA